MAWRRHSIFQTPNREVLYGAALTRNQVFWLLVIFGVVAMFFAQRFQKATTRNTPPSKDMLRRGIRA